MKETQTYLIKDKLYGKDAWFKVSPKSCIATLLLAMFWKEVQLTLKQGY
jgi:hypothetical protein